MRPYSYIAIFAAAVLAVCGCQNELELDSRVDGISFNPFIDGVTNTEMTKASAFRSADGSVEIPAWLTVSDGISVMPDSDPASSARHAELDSASDEIAGQARNDEASPATKGDQINTTGSSTALANFASAIGNTFYVTGWKGSTPARFIPSSGTGTYEAVTYSNSKWSTITTDWDGTEDAFFYAYANLPASGATVTNGSASYQALNYTAVPTTASAQKDILLGYGTFDDVTNASDRNATDKTCTAALQFHHPLTAVKFKKGTFSGTTVNFKAIYIDGVYKDGVAYLLRNGASYMMQWNMSSSTKQEVGQEGNSYLTVTDNVIGDTFLLIPQEITTSAPVTVTVVAEIDGTVHPLIATLDTGEWQAGKTNTYTLSWETPASYTFSLSSTSTVTTGSKEFTSSTSGDQNYSFTVTSTKQPEGSTAENWDWDIESYQVGDGAKVDVAASATSFIAAGLEVQEVATSGTNTSLMVTSKKWVKQSPGANAFWKNEGGTREDFLDWSPEDWTSKTSSNPIDLSKFDYTEKVPYSESNTMRTANCYIIRHAGTYKFPLVYGNALDGSYTYQPNVPSGTYSSYALTNFKNHLDQNITSPFIENHTGCDVVGSPVVVWSDHSDIITGLSITGSSQATYDQSNVRYIKFTITQEDICQNNAVIAVKDGSSNTIWSWHIWTTNDPALLKPAIPVTNYTNQEYDFFPLYCLGWVYGGTYLKREDIKITLVQKDSGNKITVTVKQPDNLVDDDATGVHYQWGRKDPMPSVSSTVSGFSTPIITTGVTLGTAIQNPGKFYIKATSNWCSSTYYNLWSGVVCKRVNTGGTLDNGVTDADVTTKTVYDPSPVGYKVPTSCAFSGFGKNGTGSSTYSGLNASGAFNNGVNFYTCKDASVTSTTPTIFFPAAGWRDNRTDSNAGQLFMGTDGNYHSAFIWGIPHATSYTMCCYFAFSDHDLYLTNNQHPTLGCSVRPITEQHL